MAEGRTLEGKDGTPLPGYLAGDDAPGGTPGLIVIQEWWGLNSQIKKMADRFAAAGFVAFAPDLYRGELAGSEDEAKHLMDTLDWERAVGDVTRAAEALKVRDPDAKVGVTGFCMGGALALLAAARIPGLAACVPFYGLPPEEAVDLGRIQARVLGHFATDDGWCTPEKVDALEKKLESAGVLEALHRYEAQHAFMNEERPEVYSEDDAKLAFERTVGFLREVLGGADAG